MKSYVGSILVEDASGAQFQMHEFLVRKRAFAIVRKRRRFALETGEDAVAADAHTFRLLTTGEVLMRAENG